MTEEITEKKLTRRKNLLPHHQLGGSTYFVTFRTMSMTLTEPEKKAVLETIKYDHGRKYHLFLAVVMDDHVHLLLRPLKKDNENYWDLSRIMKEIKGISARRMNQLTGKKGSIWLAESYDHMIRNNEDFSEKEKYILDNPLKKALASQCGEYPYLLDFRDQRMMF